MTRQPFDPNKAGGTSVPADIEDLASRTITAAITVHRKLGPGFPESIYEKALCIELNDHDIPCQSQAPVTVKYKEQIVGQGRIDILIDNKLVVELKTTESLLPLHHAQVAAYLKAMNLPLGLLVNFNTTLLKDGLKRIIK